MTEERVTISKERLEELREAERTLIALQADNLREKRKATGLTIKQLASKIGRSQSFVNLIELGERKPSIETALRLASILDCKVEDIFQEEG